MGPRLHLVATVNDQSRALIVIAEDSTELRQLLAVGLERVGFEVIQAENGAELVELVRTADHLSLIITDVRMPELDGITAVRTLRRSGTVVPVIFMSAFGDTRARHAAVELDGRWIDKPIGLNDLRAVVTGVIGDPAK